MSTEAQRKAKKKHLELLENLTVRVRKGEREKIQAFAASKGKSLNAYVVDLIQKDMEKNTGKD